MEEENDVLEVVAPEAEVEAPAQTVPYERFAKEVAKRKALEEQLAAQTPKEEEKSKRPLKAREPQFDSIADNLSVLRRLEDDEIAELRSQAKELSVDPIAFAKTKAWQSHLENIRQSRSAEDKTPEPSHRTAIYEGKTFAEVVSGEDSPETKKAAFLAQRDAILNRGRNQMM
jgi:hypothetical protein